MIEALTTVVSMLVFFAGISACVWLDQRGKTRRRELDHVERLRAIELGRPLDDAEVARAQALGSVAVTAVIGSFFAAVVTTYGVLSLMESEGRLLVLLVVWPLCALAGTGASVACAQALGRRRPAPADGRSPKEPPPSEQVTTAPRDSGA